MNPEVSKNPRGRTALATVRGADRTRNLLIQAGVAIVLIALIAVIGISIAVHRSHTNAKANAPYTGPVPTVTAPPSPDGITGSITDTGALRIGKPSAKATVRIVADLQCPACKAFENPDTAAIITNAVTSGTAAAEYNIIAFLDEGSMGSRYSSRAASAAYCVGTADPTKFLPWLTTMYQQQPEEGTKGLSDSQLVQLAQSAGYTDPGVAQCITSHRYDGWVQQKTKAVFASGVHGTPSLFINGKQVTDQHVLTDPNALRAAIQAAAS